MEITLKGLQNDQYANRNETTKHPKHPHVPTHMFHSRPPTVELNHNLTLVRADQQIHITKTHKKTKRFQSMIKIESTRAVWRATTCKQQRFVSKDMNLSTTIIKSWEGELVLVPPALLAPPAPPRCFLHTRVFHLCYKRSSHSCILVVKKPYQILRLIYLSFTVFCARNMSAALVSHSAVPHLPSESDGCGIKRVNHNTAFTALLLPEWAPAKKKEKRKKMIHKCEIWTKLWAICFVFERS